MILCVTLNPCVDRTIFVERLELDKIVAGRRSKCIPGGKGNNVARALKTLGAAVDSFVLVGGHTGCMVEDMIRDQDGITPFAFWTEAPTREVVTVVEEGTHRQAAFKEPGAEVTARERRGLAAMLRALVRGYEWVIFSGSVPSAALDDIYFELIGEVRKAGGKAVLDSSGEALAQGLRAGPYLVKANLEEAGHAVRRRLAGDAEIWRAAGEMPCGIAAITAGKEGAYVACGEERWRGLPPPVQTVNPVGSGDSFLGGMVAGLARGEPIEEALRLAMAAGAANAMVWDAATFSAEDVAGLVPGVRIRRA